MNLLVRYLLVALFAAGGGAAQAQPLASQSRGELLYNNHCIECHTLQIHWRDRKLVQDWPGLLAQVRRWQATAGLQWSDEDVKDVARHLDKTVYRLAPDKASTVVGEAKSR